MSSIFESDGWLNTTVAAVSDAIWTYVLVGALVCCGIYFTVRLRGAQFTMLGEMWRLMFEHGGQPAANAAADTAVENKETANKRQMRIRIPGISSFEAFAVGVATRVGTGNLAGVATAIAIGGPGAVFWMWLLAIIGAATAFVESTLAQLYKRRSHDGFIGGPAYYILHGMKSPGMAATFAVLLTITFGLSYNSIQSNTICDAMREAFGFGKIYTGIAIMLPSLLIVFGGIKRIARFSIFIVPVMALGYLALALLIIVMNIGKLPQVMSLIIENAFGFEQAAGGMLGMTIMAGVKRGLFSNEAGEGSAPNVAAAAHVSHPVKQGLIQALGVFTDTLVVCSCTAFIILLSGVHTSPGLDGIVMTQAAMDSQLAGTGKIVVAVAILFFSFSSIIGNYYYGEANVRFLTGSRTVLTAFRICSAGVMVMFGAVASLELVWNIGDVCMAVLTACNLIAIVYLSRHAFSLMNDYRDQKRRGITEPTFTAAKMPGLDLDAWDAKQ